MCVLASLYCHLLFVTKFTETVERKNGMAVGRSVHLFPVLFMAFKIYRVHIKSIDSSIVQIVINTFLLPIEIIVIK